MAKPHRRRPAQAAKQAPAPPPEPTRSALRENFESILVAALFAIFVRGFIAQPYKIPSGSMEENLLVGDHLVVNKVVYGTHPDRPGFPLLPHRPIRRGDVVIFRPPHAPETDYIKRVIGLPGEEVRVAYSSHRRGVRVWIDGEALQESFRREPGGPVFEEEGAAWTVNNTDVAPEQHLGLPARTFQLGEGEYFMLGDNRNHSQDSRFWEGGHAVDAERIRGRAWFIYWSFDGEGEVPAGLGPRLRFYAEIAWHFFTRSRWDRTFDVIR